MPGLPMRLTFALGTAAAASFFPGCAAEGRPTGGPVDTQGPRVVRVEPPSGTQQLDALPVITLTLDELVDPLSVPGAVKFAPDISFSSLARGRRLIIRPDEPYQPGRVYVLTLQRKLRDYQRNSIPRAYQFVFSTGGPIPSGLIRGEVAGADPDRPMEVGLFRWHGIGAVPDSSNPDADRNKFVLVQSLGVAVDGSFAFAYLPDGNYRLAAVEGGLGDFPAGLHYRPYALPSFDSLLVRGDTLSVAMRRSNPLALPQIATADWVSDSYLQLTFDVPFGDAHPPASVFATHKPGLYGYLLPEAPSGDSVTIELGAGTTLLGEAYALAPLAVPTQELPDTLPPTLTVPGNTLRLQPIADSENPRFGTARGRLTFSEPVRLGSGFKVHVTGADSLARQGIEVALNRVSPLTLTLDVPQPERYNRVTIPGHQISDAAGNTMADSLLAIALEFVPPASTGSILGSIAGRGGTGGVVVEVLEAQTGRRVGHTVTHLGRYRIDHVPPGFYTLFGHELIGEQPLPYYSGRWTPYHRSARFGFHSQVVEVRPRWEVDGIDINLKARILVLPLQGHALRKD